MQDENFTKQIFSETLSRAMAGRKQSQVAQAASLTQSAVSQYLGGTRLPGCLELYRLSIALNVTMEELLTGDKPLGGSAVDAAVWKQKCQEAERRLDGLKSTLLAAVKKF